MPHTQECSRAYHNGPVQGISDLLVDVIAGIFDNATTFPAPPFTKVKAEAVNSEFISAKSAYNNGGKNQEPPYIKAKTAAVSLLDDGADFVDGIAKGDPMIITTSGYTPTFSNKEKEPTHIPGQVMYITEDKESVDNQIIVECETFGAGVSYTCIVIPGGNPIPDLFSLSNNGEMKLPALKDGIILMVNHQRKKVINGLTSGVKYSIFFFVTNAKGVGPISAAKIITCS